MFYKSLIACTLIPLVVSASFSQVRLMDSIAVEAPYIELGEIAFIESGNLREKKALQKLVVAEAPKNAHPKVISAYRIRSLLEAKGLLENTEVLGSQTTVTLLSRVVEQEEITAAIKEWVAKESTPDTEFSIDFVRLPKRWSVPAGGQVKIVVQPANRKQAGNLSFTAMAMVGAEVVSQTRLRVRVKKSQPCWVLRQPLQRAEVITLGHVHKEMVDVTDFSGMPIANFEQIAGLSAKMRIKVGKILDAKDFTKPVVMKKGSLNRIIVRNGAVELSISGAQAMQDGREGEIVQFSNPMNSREPLRAKVVGEGLGVIELR